MSRLRETPQTFSGALALGLERERVSVFRHCASRLTELLVQPSKPLVGRCPRRTVTSYWNTQIFLQQRFCVRQVDSCNDVGDAAKIQQPQIAWISGRGAVQHGAQPANVSPLLVELGDLEIRVDVLWSPVKHGLIFGRRPRPSVLGHKVR